MGEWIAQEVVRQLEPKLDKLMKTQLEIIADLKAQTLALVEIGKTLQATLIILEKVATETKALKDKIVVLEEAVRNQTGASPELEAAMADAVAQVAILQATVALASSKVQEVDALVPDAPAEPQPAQPAPA